MSGYLFTAMFKLEKVPLQAVNAQFDVPESSVGIYE